MPALPRRASHAAVGGGLLTAAALAFPWPAEAHGIQQRADLPVPQWLFAWGATLVLIVSFVALASLWPSPRLERDEWRSLPRGFGAALGSRAVEALCGALGLSLLAVVVWAGYAGRQGAQDNLAPTFILVVFWVGAVFASVVFGDVFRAFSPWRAGGRLVGWLARTVRGGRPPGHWPYPQALGRWPAAAGLLAFTWIELVSGLGEFPDRLVTAAVVYSAVTWVAMALYGVDTWHERGEAFGVYFGLFSRVSVFETRDGVVGIRPLLSGLTRLSAPPGTVAMVAVMIGTVTFDGLSQGGLWRDTLSVALYDLFAGAGAGADAAIKLAASVGLLACVGLIAGFYAIGTGGARSVGKHLSAERLRRGFVHSLVPIALVYVMAHYLTLLLFQGQAIGYLASDPLGRGWDLFGTAASAVDYGIIAQSTAWYLQVGFVVLGHMAGLALAHDRALVLFDDARVAVRSQYWMLGIMVGFTSLALWLLAQANA